ncbi:hypothetical protein Ais01nite_02490 [Asanoa ishikariensis]|nr:hypothetical protein Ais01nite_02490 [Asanoa ishikariensis]
MPSDELSLGLLCCDAASVGLRVVAFHEPDLGGALTATWSEGGENMTPSTDARSQLVELAAERDGLRAQLDGDLTAVRR